jgi:hypothetical protein
MGNDMEMSELLCLLSRKILIENHEIDFYDGTKAIQNWQ